MDFNLMLGDTPLPHRNSNFLNTDAEASGYITQASPQFLTLSRLDLSFWV
jgi:hypothetical protein